MSQNVKYKSRWTWEVHSEVSARQQSTIAAPFRVFTLWSSFIPDVDWAASKSGAGMISPYCVLTKDTSAVTMLIESFIKNV